MDIVDNSIKKLRLLGDEVLVLSDKAFIGVNKATGVVKCYTLDKDGNLLSKAYNSVMREKGYFIGLDDNEDHILDKELRILSKFKYEKVLKIIDNIVVVYRPSDQAYRLSSVYGKPLSNTNIRKIKIWQHTKDLKVTMQWINRDLYNISIISEDKIIKSIEITDVVEIATGRRYNGQNIIVVQTRDDVKVYNESMDKILLVVKGGHIEIAGYNCKIFDKYFQNVSNIQLKNKLY